MLESAVARDQSRRAMPIVPMFVQIRPIFVQIGPMLAQLMDLRDVPAIRGLWVFVAEEPS